MSDPFEDRGVPRGALLGAGLLIVVSITGALAGRLTGVGRTALPQAAAVETRDLLFMDRADGAVVVTEPGGEPVAVVEPGTGGFVRGVLRGLAQERMRRDVGADAGTPFELTRWDDGRLSLSDPVTDRHVYLDAFGTTNVAAFAVLLDQRPPPQS
jgi:putative photosynthetic complex assembly protein